MIWIRTVHASHTVTQLRRFKLLFVDVDFWASLIAVKLNSWFLISVILRESWTRYTNCIMFREVSLRTLISCWTLLSKTFTALWISPICRSTSFGGCSYVIRQTSFEYSDWNNWIVCICFLWEIVNSSRICASWIRYWIKCALVPLAFKTSERCRISVLYRLTYVDLKFTYGISQSVLHFHMILTPYGLQFA